MDVRYWRTFLVFMRPLPEFWALSRSSCQIAADPPYERSRHEERAAFHFERQARQPPRRGSAGDAGVVLRIELRFVTRALEHFRRGVPRPVTTPGMRADGRQRDVSLRRVGARRV